MGLAASQSQSVQVQTSAVLSVKRNIRNILDAYNDAGAVGDSEQLTFHVTPFFIGRACFSESYQSTESRPIGFQRADTAVKTAAGFPWTKHISTERR